MYSHNYTLYQANEDQQQQHLDDDAKVKLRDKRNAAMREPSKRHSWSPRTTTTTNTVTGPGSNFTATAAAALPPTPPPDESSSRASDAEKMKQKCAEEEELERQRQPLPMVVALNGKFTARSTVLAKVLVDTKTATRNVIESAGQVQSQQLPQAPPPPALPPTKNAMQRGFVCEAQPLIDDSKEEVEEEDLSDAGTYTLDGDNYTEEQKEMMDIDARKARQQLNKWDEEGDSDEMTFLKCKPRHRIQRPTSFEPSLEVSGGGNWGTITVFTRFCDPRLRRPSVIVIFHS